MRSQVAYARYAARLRQPAVHGDGVAVVEAELRHDFQIQLPQRGGQFDTIGAGALENSLGQGTRVLRVDIDITRQQCLPKHHRATKPLLSLNLEARKLQLLGRQFRKHVTLREGLGADRDAGGPGAVRQQQAEQREALHAASPSRSSKMTSGSAEG